MEAMEVDKSIKISQDSQDSKSSETTDCDKPSNCYCGKERNMNLVELLCATCTKWYHESCIGYQLGKLVPFLMNYVFICKNCSPTGLESFRKNQASIPQMCITAIANMQQAAVKDGRVQQLFSKDREIIPFIDQYWEAMTTMPRRVTQSWYATVQRALHKDSQTTFVIEESSVDGPMFGLVMSDLYQIKPNYDAMVKGGTLRLSEDGLAQANNTSKAGRQAKRKLANEAGPTNKKGRPGNDVASSVKLPSHGYPLEHPFNKDGYRYILAEPDPHAPFRQEFDEGADWAGKPIPGWLYRTLSPNAVLLALHDRAPQLKISEDRLEVIGEKGYCMVRATHSVVKGSWYYEATIEEMPEGGATRIGWGQEYANLQAPLGYDKFGYSWRSRKGTRFHESHGKSYSPGYAEGDTVGFLIDLPEEEGVNYLPNTYKDRPLVKFKNHLYYEEKDRSTEALKTMKPRKGGKIMFFKNGECQGEAFIDINSGSYYPALSIHRGVTVSLNFGPDLKHPEVLTKYNCRAMHDRVEELICEQTVSDMLYFTENEGKLRLDTFIL